MRLANVVVTVGLILASFPAWAQTREAPGRGFLIPEGAAAALELQRNLHIELEQSLPPGVGAARSQVCDPNARSFSWRTQGKVTPAKFQGGCGSCWAFAVTAAVETSFMVYHDTSLAAPDLSEQEVLDCASGFGAPANVPSPYDCTGGWFAAPLRMAQVKGILDDTSYRSYDGARLTCQPVTAQRTTVNSWTPLPSVGPSNWLAPAREIKEALCTHGGVIAALNTAATGFPTSGVFTTVIEGPTNSAGQVVDHAIQIVGWDDDEGAWIIKNSWGTWWGDEGFGKVKYGTRNLGFMAMAVQANTDLVIRTLPPPAATEFLNLRQKSLTSFPELLDRQRRP